MEIILRINQEEYSVSRDIDDPDTDNVMFAIECLIKQVPLDKEVLKQYLIEWVEEMKNQ